MHFLYQTPEKSTRTLGNTEEFPLRRSIATNNLLHLLVQATQEQQDQQERSYPCIFLDKTPSPTVTQDLIEESDEDLSSDEEPDEEVELRGLITAQYTYTREDLTTPPPTNKTSNDQQDELSPSCPAGSSPHSVSTRWGPCDKKRKLGHVHNPVSGVFQRVVTNGNKNNGASAIPARKIVTG